MFLFDNKQDDIVAGKSERELIEMFPDHVDGSKYDKKSYRGSFMSKHDATTKFMWLSGDQDDWGQCILLKENEAPIVIWVKG